VEEVVAKDRFEAIKIAEDRFWNPNNKQTNPFLTKSEKNKSNIDLEEGLAMAEPI
jgi:hypothetical protein